MPDGIHPSLSGPNVMKETDDTWHIPIAVTRTESSFVIVRLRADSFSEALTRAREEVHTLCVEGRIETDSTGSLDETDWLLEGYRECGIEKTIDGSVADYEVDFDLSDAPTRAETKLSAAQLAFNLKERD